MAPRFDGTDLVPVRKPKKRAPAPRRLSAPRFDGERVVNEEAA
jgi:hypothetical protein